MYRNKPIVYGFNTYTGGENTPKQHRKSRRGSSAVFGVLLIVLVTFVSGILFYTFVMENINFATDKISTQIASLLLKSFTINSTHIIAFLKNTGSSLVEITSAYVNGLATAIVNLVKIAPNAIGSVILKGNFLSGNTYDVKLASIFNTEVTFKASL
jgi:predicted PurR-regulated permease PerM